MPITAVLGEQRGDEGKGRFVDMLMEEEGFDIGARFNGGPNAGHTVVLPDGTEHDLHGIPSSVIHDKAIGVVGCGAVVNPELMLGEISTLKEKGIDINPSNFMIDGASHFILPHHIYADEIAEGSDQAQGSTKTGIRYVYSDMHKRVGIRANIINHNPGEIEERAYEGMQETRPHKERSSSKLKKRDREAAKEYVDTAKKLGKYIADVSFYLSGELEQGKKVLAEGAQAFWLDIKHGMHPDVSSSGTTAAAVADGLGVSPFYLEDVRGVSKIIPSHVGSGHFVTEIEDEELANRLRGNPEDVDSEYGTTTGRPRRVGYLDLPMIRTAQRQNGGANGKERTYFSKGDNLRLYGPTTKICDYYIRSKDGKEEKIYSWAPKDAYKIRQCRPHYVPFENSEEDISEVRIYEDLPEKTQTIFNYIGANILAPIALIGVGPRRDQVIKC